MILDALEIARGLVEEADAQVHRLEKLLAGPIGHDMGYQIGYSGTIAVKLSAARGYLELADKKERKKSRKLRGYIDSISSLTRQLGL